ncbi:hypothetical protein RQP46_003136 [Phenoliferia psychrophenolica]
MATFADLPRELLTHILHLLNQCETPKEEQRGRFAFGLVARAFYLASVGTTDFHVAGKPQAIALAAKLEREKVWALQEERKAKSGRTTRSTFSMTRPSRVCRLSATLDSETNGKALANLFRATPVLDILELTIGADELEPDELDPDLEKVLGRLVSLRGLRLFGEYPRPKLLTQVLIPLANLKVLDLTPINGYTINANQTNLHRQLYLPRLRGLLLHLEDQPGWYANLLLDALATGSTPELRDLNIFAPFSYFSPEITQRLIPLFSRLVHLTWTTKVESISTRNRDAVLDLLGSMRNLKYLEMSTWIIEEHDQPGPYISPIDVDHKLFDTLATLPSLYNVELAVPIGILSEGHVTSYIQTSKALLSLRIVLMEPNLWRQEARILGQCNFVES